MATDAYGPVDQPPLGDLWWPEDLSPDRLMERGRQVGWRDAGGGLHYFDEHRQRRKGRAAPPLRVSLLVPALPPTALDCPHDGNGYFQRQQDLEFLRRMGPAL